MKGLCGGDDTNLLSNLGLIGRGWPTTLPENATRSRGGLCAVYVMHWNVLLDGGFYDHRYHYHLIRFAVKNKKVGNSEWHSFGKRCLLAQRCFLMSLEPDRKTQVLLDN